MLERYSSKRIVFFDLDGTLHQQDLFSGFIRYLIWHLPINWVVLVAVLPMVVLGRLLCGYASRWPMSLLLWAVTVGHTEKRLKRLEHDFVVHFKQTVIAYPLVQKQLAHYLSGENTEVWIITGSPQHLVEAVYDNAFFLSKVTLIGSQLDRRAGGWVVSLRCLGHEKVKQLEKRLGPDPTLYSGFSDSSHDDPVLALCQQRWRVDRHGNVSKLDK